MIKILYSNKNIIVCVKPYGVLSQKDAKGEEGLPEILARETNCKAVYPVHRLDRPVGGVMVFAKDTKSAAALSAENALEKTYLALISGCREEKRGILSDYLYKDGSKGKSFVVAKERKGCKYAELEYEVLHTFDDEEDGKVSLVRVKLHTGRTHQIRVQFSSRGHSLLGDGKYGSRVKCEHIALWSHSLALIEPRTQKKVVYTQLPPKESIWEKYAADDHLN